MSLFIINLTPSTVRVGWEGPLTISGQELGKPGFVEIDGDEQKIVSWSVQRIVTTVTRTTTANAGKKRLIVHDEDGGFGEIEWQVEP